MGGQCIYATSLGVWQKIFIIVADSYKNMPEASQKAVPQINERRCGYSSIGCFGVAFYKKYCAVTAEEYKL